MAERAYTVKELDALRQVHEDKYLYGRYSGLTGSGMSRTYYAVEMAKRVEEGVRTSMIAGHTAEDLLASEQSTTRKP